MQFSKWVTIGFGAMCLVAVAGVLNLPHLYYMAAILLTLPFVSWLMGWYSTSGLEFDRELPPVAWEQEEVDFKYHVHNNTPVARYFLSFHENVPDWLQPVQDDPPRLNVGAKESVSVRHRFRLLKRGVYDSSSFSVTAMDPLGVFAFTHRVQASGELVVYPLPRQVPLMTLGGSDRFGFQDFTSLVLHGSSVDPDGVRLYAPGDPLRRVHWRQTARTGRLTVIEYEDTQSVNLVVGLELREGSDTGTDTSTTLEYAVRIAASLCDAALRTGASIQLSAPTDGLPEQTVDALQASARLARGDIQATRILSALARVQATSTGCLAGAIGSLAAVLPPGTTVVALTMRPDMELVDALCGLRRQGARPLAVYIDPETFPGGRGAVRSDDVKVFHAALGGADVPVFIVRHEAGNTGSAETS